MLFLKIIGIYALIGFAIYNLLLLSSFIVSKIKKPTEEEKNGLDQIKHWSMILYSVFVWPHALYFLINKSKREEIVKKNETKQSRKSLFTERLEKAAEKKKNKEIK
jgi:hypothetical protein